MPSVVAVPHAGWRNSLPEFRPPASLLESLRHELDKRRGQGHDEQHVSVGRSSTAPARRGFLRRARQLPQHAPELVRRHGSFRLQHLAGRHLHRYVPASDRGTAEADRRPAARRAGPRPPRLRRLCQSASRGTDRSKADRPPGRIRPRRRVHGPGDRRLPRGAARRPARPDGADPGTAPRSAGAARRPAGPARGIGAPGAAGRAGLSRGLHRAVLPGAALPGAGLPRAGLPRAGLPRAGLPRAGLPRAALPGAGLPGTRRRTAACGRELR